MTLKTLWSLDALAPANYSLFSEHTTFFIASMLLQAVPSFQQALLPLSHLVTRFRLL